MDYKEQNIPNQNDFNSVNFSQNSGKKDFNLLSEILSWISVIVIAAIIALVLNNFIIANSRVPSASMENTIMTNDRIIGLRMAYLFSDPQRGDIVIFKKHIALVSDRRNKNGVPYIIHHNDPWQLRYEEDVLASRRDIVGHYRFPKE